MDKTSEKRIPDGWLLLLLTDALFLFIEWVSESKAGIAVTLCIIAVALIIIFSAMAAEKSVDRNTTTISSESVKTTDNDWEKNAPKPHVQSEQITIDATTANTSTVSRESVKTLDRDLDKIDMPPQLQSAQITFSHFDTMTTLKATIYIGAFIGGLIGIILGYIVGYPISLIPTDIYQAFTKAEGQKAWEAVFPWGYRSVVVCCIVLGTILAPILVGMFFAADIAVDCQSASEIWQYWENATREVAATEETHVP